MEATMIENDVRMGTGMPTPLEIPAALRVARHLTSEHLPPARMQGYDYVLAGNGLFKRARSRHVEATICLAAARVAGLPGMVVQLHLLHQPLPERFLWTALQDARARSRSGPTEAMYHVRIDEGRTRLVRPRQTASQAGISYEGGNDVEVACDLHSHCELRAFFSGTDNRDEQGFRFYAVMGQIWTRPQIAVRLGMYGDFVAVPVVTLFEGPGPFVDVGIG